MKFIEIFVNIKYATLATAFREFWQTSLKAQKTCRIKYNLYT